MKLAESANDDGVTWPSKRTLAQDVCATTRSIKNWRKELEDLSLIEVIKRVRGNGSSTSNVYRLLMGQVEGERLSPSPQEQVPQVRGGKAFQGEGERLSPPDLSPSEKDLEPPRKNGDRPRSRARERDPIWDALTDLFGDATTESAETLRGKICRSLKRAGATADDVKQRAERYPKVMPPETLLTETALEKHWPLLAPPRRAAPPCPDCGVGGGNHVADCPQAK
jgi:hypothetical protein